MGTHLISGWCVKHFKTALKLTIATYHWALMQGPSRDDGTLLREDRGCKLYVSLRHSPLNFLQLHSVFQSLYVVSQDMRQPEVCFAANICVVIIPVV